jgi:NADPH-dependent ferric siderophore reductase
MLIQFNYSDVPASSALEEHVRGELDHAVARFTPRLTRIEVHLADVNSPKKGGPADKRCRLEARPAGRDPIVVDDSTDDIYKSVTGAAGKLARALTHRLEHDTRAAGGRTE